jgi:hypothetical protein
MNLIAALQEHVKGKLAPYEYPKEIEFIDQLPMTTTGKVQRRVLRLQEEERPRGRACVGVRSGRCGLRPKNVFTTGSWCPQGSQSRNRGARRRPCWWPDKVRNDECGLLPPCRVPAKAASAALQILAGPPARLRFAPCIHCLCGATGTMNRS